MKINILTLALFLLCFSCKEYEDVEIPADLPRLPELCAQYEKLLAEAEDGWIAEYQPTAGSGGVSIYMKFHDNGTVDIQSNYPGNTDVQKEIRYRVSGIVKPELTFETECIWAKLYQEAGGDYLFSIESKGNDTLLLKPVRPPYERPTCVVTRANAGNKDVFYKSISTLQKLDGFIKNAVAYFKNLELTGPQGTIKVFTEFNITQGHITLTYQNEQQEVATLERQFKIEGDRIRFIPSAIIGNIEVQYLQLGETDEQGNMLIPDAGLGLSGKWSATHIPAFPYKGTAAFYTTTNNLRLTASEANEASEAMQKLIRPIYAISDYYSLNLYINYFGPRHPTPNAFCFMHNGNWLYYYINLDTKGEDVVYHGYVPPTGAAADQMGVVKPFLDKICDPAGYTVILSADKKTCTLVSRSDSRYWIKLDVAIIKS